MEKAEIEKAVSGAEDRLENSCKLENIPSYMFGVIRRYVIDGIIPGDFLQAVVSNDLMRSATKADDKNVKLLLNYSRLVYNDFPYQSHGSPEDMENWRKLGGLRGLLAKMDAPIRVVVDDEVVGAQGTPIKE